MGLSWAPDGAAVLLDPDLDRACDRGDREVEVGVDGARRLVYLLEGAGLGRDAAGSAAMATRPWRRRRVRKSKMTPSATRAESTERAIGLLLRRCGGAGPRELFGAELDEEVGGADPIEAGIPLLEEGPGAGEAAYPVADQAERRIQRRVDVPSDVGLRPHRINVVHRS
jgi:hypothetical protein